MEDVLVPGAGVEELPGVRGVERSEGQRGNWRDPPRPRVFAREAGLSITVMSGKWRLVERKSEGVVVAVTVGTT